MFYCNLALTSRLAFFYRVTFFKKEPSIPSSLLKPPREGKGKSISYKRWCYENNCRVCCVCCPQILPKFTRLQLVQMTHRTSSYSNLAMQVAIRQGNPALSRVLKLRIRTFVVEFFKPGRSRVLVIFFPYETFASKVLPLCSPWHRVVLLSNRPRQITIHSSHCLAPQRRVAIQYQVKLKASQPERNGTSLR